MASAPKSPEHGIVPVDERELAAHLGRPKPCAVCGGVSKESWARQGVFTAVRCTSCGLVWVDPFLTEEGLRRYYAGYLSARVKDARLMALRQRQYELDRDFLQRAISAGRVLDVGCGEGRFLATLSDRFEKYGLELDPESAALARARYPFGSRIVPRVLGEDGFDPHFFDLVIMRGVIEHLPDPRSAVRRVSELLKPGGMFFITATPDVSAFCATLYRERWNQFQPAEHLYYFSVPTLSRLCADYALALVAHEHPYLETPYADVEQDHLTVLRDAQLIREGRRQEVGRSPAFWGTMMTVLFRKRGGSAVAAGQPAGNASEGQGTALWFTGLPCSGKTTIATLVKEALQARGTPVELLDGDEIRQQFSAGVGFSREDRNSHLRRVAYLCHLLTKHGVVVLASFVSPYRENREYARTLIGRAFVEVHVDTPLEECIRRDVKGMYRKALAGELKQFTGVSDPYEPPEQAEVVIRTMELSAEAGAQRVLEALDQRAGAA